MDWLTVGKEFGLLGIVITLISAGFWLLLKWTLQQFKVELDENRKERKEYLLILSGMKQEMVEHNLRAKEFQCNVQKEHNEMIVTLGRINGYK
jgi:hypothetical protein